MLSGAESRGRPKWEQRDQLGSSWQAHVSCDAAVDVERSGAFGVLSGGRSNDKTADRWSWGETGSEKSPP